MTEDRVQDGDELNFDDDDEFIIEDSHGDGEDIFAEADLEAGLPVEGADKQSKDGDLFDVEDHPDDFVVVDEDVGGSASPDVDDILFEALSDRSESSEFSANLGDAFSESDERSASQIEEYNLDDALGVGASAGASDVHPIEEEEDELFAIEDEDIELIEETLELAAEDDAECFVLSEDADEDDPIYGAEQKPAEEAFFDDEVGEVDYSSYEGEYVDSQAEQEVQLLGGGQGRVFPLRAVASLAAVLMVAAAGTVVFLKPEWVGLKVDFQPIEVIEVARPSVEVDIKPPEIVAVAVTDPAPVNPLELVKIPQIAEPGPESSPDIVEPSIPTVPVDPTPVAPRGPIGPNVALPEQGDVLQVGEFLRINLAESAKVIEPMVSGKRIDLAALQPGMEAYAQLPNEAFFIGTVRKLNDSEVTLNIGSGEVTFAYDELATLTTLAEAGGSVRGKTDSQQGYVRLDNHNRLYGTVVQAKESERVLLESMNRKVRIPKDTIEEIGIAIKGGVEIPEQGDDEWMRAQVRKRMGSDRGLPQSVPPGHQTSRPVKK